MDDIYFLMLISSILTAFTKFSVKSSPKNREAFLKETLSKACGWKLIW
jgi:hypothetical protein